MDVKKPRYLIMDKSFGKHSYCIVQLFVFINQSCFDTHAHTHTQISVYVYVCVYSTGYLFKN